MPKPNKPVNFIAVDKYGEYVVSGETLDEVIASLSIESEWDGINDFEIFEVKRVGKAKVAVEWETR